MSPEFN